MNQKQKARWGAGSVFAVPLPDGSFGVGQVIDLMWANVVYCALTSLRIHDLAAQRSLLTTPVALVALSREQLDHDAWHLLGESPLIAHRGEFRNEQFAAKGFVGAKIYDAALAEDFLAAYHALTPWDNWHKPDYLDEWLVSPALKPSVLRYKSDERAI